MKILLALLPGFWIGLLLPDVDQRVFFLVHRSVVTHSVLLLLLAHTYIRPERIVYRLLFAGAYAGLAIHLLFDLFPKSWRGYALIHVPLIGRLPGVVSVVWILLNIGLCCYLFIRLFRTK